MQRLVRAGARQGRVRRGALGEVDHEGEGMTVVPDQPDADAGILQHIAHEDQVLGMRLVGCEAIVHEVEQPAVDDDIVTLEQR